MTDQRVTPDASDVGTEPTGSLAGSDDRFRRLVESTPLGVWVSEPGKGLVYCNERLLEQFAADFADVSGFGIMERIAEEDREHFQACLYDLWVEGRPLDLELHIRRGREERVVHARARVVSDEAGEASAVVGTSEDVTQRVRVESLRRELIDRLVDVSDRERAKLSADLHAGPAQDLTATRLHLERLERLVVDETVGREVAAARAMVEKAQQDLRLLMDELRPLDLRTEGLHDALSAYAVDVSSHPGLVVTVVSDLAGEPARDVRDVAYQLVQDAVGAVRRRGEPSVLDVRVGQAGDDLVLVVVDDAGAIDPDLLESQVFDSAGLSMVRDRALAAGGSCELSTSESGSTLRFTVPMRYRAPRAPRRL